MTIRDFMDMCLDDTTEFVQIYNFSSEDYIYKGYYNDMPEEYKDLDNITWNTINNGICFNVELEDEEK